MPSQSYTYDRDALGRAVDLYSGSTSQPTFLVTGVSYTGAGRMLGMTFAGGYTETRQYNANRQLTRQTAGAAQGMDLTYNYGTAGTPNNGRVASVTDNLSGEQVTYTYDQLNRLTQAMTNDAWGLSFGYDGYGNLTQQTRVQGATAPTMSVTVNPATNRIATAGYGYDANGNVTQTPDGRTYGYDVANRMVSNGATYNPKNQRVYDGTYFYYYGVGGELIGKYQPNWSATLTVGGIVYIPVSLQDHQPNLYFGGRAIRLQGHGAFVMTDRLGSVRVNGSGQRMNYYPYGAEVGTETVEGRVKFGTYTRDSAGVDYADQRYYGAAMGRFLTADPSSAGNPAKPATWNRYTYVVGDPVNFMDRRGLFYSLAGGGANDGEDQDQPILGPNYFGPQTSATPTKPKGVHDKGGWNTDPNTTGQTAWQYLNSIWTNCLSDFNRIPGFNSSQFGDTLMNMSFIDARDPQTRASTVDFYAHNGDTRKLATVLANADAAVTIPGTNIVIAGGNYFSNNTQTEQIGIAVHEALHMTFPQLSDTQLAGVLMNFGFQPSASFTSGEITDWIVGSPNHASTNGGGCKNPNP